MVQNIPEVYGVRYRFPSLSAKMLAVFNCREIHGTYYLEADMDIECYTPVHTTYQSLAALGVLLYPIGIPISFTALMLWCAYVHNHIPL